MAGHPDYQAYAEWRGTPLVNVNQNFPQGNTVLGPFTVAHYSGLYVVCQLQTQQLSLLLEFSDDPSMAVIDDTYTWMLTTSTGLRVTVPMISTYVQVHLSCPVAGNTGVRLKVLPTNIGQQDVAYPVVGNNVSVLSTSVPAGGAVTYPLAFIQAGQAGVLIVPEDSSAKLQPRVSLQTAAAAEGNQVWQAAPAAGTQAALLMLPDAPCMYTVHNTDGAAAHPFHGSLIPGGPT